MKNLQIQAVILGAFLLAFYTRFESLQMDADYIIDGIEYKLTNMSFI